MREGDAASVFEGVEGFSVLVEFEQFHFGVVFAEKRVGGGAFVDQQGLVFELGDVGNRFFVGGNDAEGDFHVGGGEIDGFGAFGGLGEVGQNEVDFAGAGVFDAVGRFGEDEFHFVGAAEQVFGHFFGDFDVEALVFALAVHVAEGGFVTEHADADDAFFFDGGHGVGGGCAAGGLGGVAAAAAGGQTEGEGCACKQGFEFAVELHMFSFRLRVGKGADGLRPSENLAAGNACVALGRHTLHFVQ